MTLKINLSESVWIFYCAMDFMPSSLRGTVYRSKTQTPTSSVAQTLTQCRKPTDTLKHVIILNKRHPVIPSNTQNNVVKACVHLYVPKYLS